MGTRTGGPRKRLPTRTLAVRACERYVEWCDYMPDRMWRVFGWALAPTFRAADEYVQRAYVKARD